MGLSEGQQYVKCTTIIDLNGLKFFSNKSKKKAKTAPKQGRLFDVFGTLWETLGAKSREGKRRKERGREDKRKERKKESKSGLRGPSRGVAGGSTTL